MCRRTSTPANTSQLPLTSSSPAALSEFWSHTNLIPGRPRGQLCDALGVVPPACQEFWSHTGLSSGRHGGHLCSALGEGSHLSEA